MSAAPAQIQRFDNPTVAPSRVTGTQVIALKARNPDRPTLEVGGVVWWETRRYVIDGISLVGHTWVAELTREQDFLKMQRLGWCVPCEELIVDDGI